MTSRGDSSGFIPEGRAAELCAAAVDAAFRESVQAIAKSLSEHEPNLDASFEPESREATPRSPYAFATYFDLLRAVLADDVSRAVEALSRLRRRLGEPAPASLRGWGDLGDDERACLLGHLNDDPSTRLVLTMPSPRSLVDGRTAIEAAFALFDGGAPEIAAEIRAVVRHIILVSGTVNEGLEFDGATSFATRGALILNADRHGTRIDAVDGLAHESAHAVLFDRSSGRPFVENPEDERYQSPLRSDPRPLDGIYHAAFVSARMHYAHARVLASGLLDDAETAMSRERVRESRAAFEDGRETLRRYARPTPLGERTLAAAERFMDSR